eukprot:COSAG05_NODE_14715_length_389_cov_1.227586_1_plen_31_part_01
MYAKSRIRLDQSDLAECTPDLFHHVAELRRI